MSRLTQKDLEAAVEKAAKKDGTPRYIGGGLYEILPGFIVNEKGYENFRAAMRAKNGER